jgi:phage-related protein
MAIVVPIKEDEKLDPEEIIDSVKKIFTYLFDELLKSQEESGKGIKDLLQKIVNGIVDCDEDEQTKKKRKETLWELFKQIKQKKWFETSTKMFGNIWKATKALGSSFWDLLLMLGLLAIFDPSGSFITTVISFLADALVWIIDAIGRMLPTIIGTIVKLIPILINASLKAALRMADAFSRMFTDWAKKLPKGSFIRAILELFAFLTSKQGPIQTITRAIGQFFSELLEGKFFKAIVNLLFNFGQAIGSVIEYLWQEYKGWTIVILAVVMLVLFLWLGPVGFFIVLAVSLLALIIRYWENIKNFFSYIFSAIWEGIKWIGNLFVKFWDWIVSIFNSFIDRLVDDFKKLWETLKTIGKAIWDFLVWMFMLPYNAAKTSWDYLVKAWDVIVGWISKIWPGIKATFVSIISRFLKFKNKFVDSIKNMFNAILEWVKSLPGKIWNSLKNVGSGLVNVGKAIWDAVTGAFSSFGSWFYDNIIAPLGLTIEEMWFSIRNLFKSGMLKGENRQLIRLAEAAGLQGSDAAGQFAQLLEQARRGNVTDTKTLSEMGITDAKKQNLVLELLKGIANSAATGDKEFFEKNASALERLATAFENANKTGKGDKAIFRAAIDNPEKVSKATGPTK